MKRQAFLPLALLLCSTAVVACGDDDGDDDDDSTDGGPDSGPMQVMTIEGCHPLSHGPCAYPFPNMALTRADTSTPTGIRLAFTTQSLGLSTTDRGDRAAFAEWLNRADGFSLGTPILAQLGPQTVDRASLPSIDDPEASTKVESSIQLIDMEARARIPCWAETDLLEPMPELRSLMIRQAAALLPDHDYLVVITDRVKDMAGMPIAPSAAYRALRDDVATQDMPLEALRAEYDDLFDLIEDLDVEREHTILAWKFHTFSDAFGTTQAKAFVDAAREIVDEDPSMLAFTRTSCKTSVMEEATALDCEHSTELHSSVWRELRGTFSVPLFLDAEGLLATEGGPVTAGGTPRRMGTEQADLVIHIPISLRGMPAESAPILVFGHGLLASPEYYVANPTDEAGVMRVGDALHAVVVATRWTGLSDTDVQTAAAAVADFNNERKLADRLVQGMINTQLVVPFVRAVLATQPELGVSMGTGSLVDPDRAYYYGISQGGIFGTTFMAMSPDVRTGVLHVPTSMYATVLQHSPQFSTFQSLLGSLYPRGSDQQLFLAYLQRLFDPLEPANFAGHLGHDPLTPLGTKSCLFQVNWGDKDAPDINEFALARTHDFPQIAPTPHALFGIDEITTPTPARTIALSIFDPGLGRGVFENDKGAMGPMAHGATRRNPEVRDQIVDYLTMDGVVVNHCDGPCTITPVPAGM